MQELPPEAEVAADSVLPIAGHGKPDRCQVDPYLVRTAGLEPHLEERMRRERLDELEMGRRIPWLVGVQRAPGGIAAVATDRGVDSSRTRLRRSAHESGVAPLELAPPDRILEALVHLLRARDDDKPGCVSIETMDDARPLGRPARRTEREQLTRECCPSLTGAGMNGDAGGLVDDDEVLIRVPHLDGDGLRSESVITLGYVDLDDRSRLDAVALRALLAVDPNGPLEQQPLGEGARADLGTSGEKLVEADTGVRFSDGEANRRHGTYV